MPIYHYKALDKEQKVISGKITAKDKREAEHLLNKSGQVMISCVRGFAAIDSLFEKKVTLRDFIIFTRQFSVMMTAGISIQHSLDLVASGTESPPLKQALTEMTSDLRAGLTLSESMQKKTNIFDEFLIGLMKIAEVSGAIDEVMKRAADFYENEGKLQKKVKGAVMYPITLLIVAVVVVIYLIVAVVPIFTGMFVEMGVEDLPGSTKAIVAISDFLSKYAIIFVALTVGLIVFIKMFFKKESNKRMLHKWMLDNKLVGELVKKIEAARFARSMDILLKSGVTIMESFDLMDWIIGNLEIRERLKECRNIVAVGKTYSSALEASNAFPIMLVNMVRVGEETGSLELVLDKTSTFFDEEAESAIDTFIKAVEPIMLFVIAILIFFIVMAVFLPMFDIYDSM